MLPDFLQAKVSNVSLEGETAEIADPLHEILDNDLDNDFESRLSVAG